MNPLSDFRFIFQLGSKLFCNAQDMMQRRKLEQEAELLHSIKLEEQRMMNFQLRDVKNQQYNQQLIPSLSVAAPNSSLQSQPQITKSLDLPFDAINQEIPEGQLS